MIRITMELLPFGFEQGKRTLGVIEVANDGTGTAAIGNYTYRLSHAGRYYNPKTKKPYKKGWVAGHRRAASPYKLLYKVLKDAGEV